MTAEPEVAERCEAATMTAAVEPAEPQPQRAKAQESTVSSLLACGLLFVVKTLLGVHAKALQPQPKPESEPEPEQEEEPEVEPEPNADEQEPEPEQEQEPEAEQAEGEVEVWARALFPWDAAAGAEDGDLLFRVGDLFRVVSCSWPGDGWLTGESAEGSQRGIFPANHVRLLDGGSELQRERTARTAVASARLQACRHKFEELVAARK